MNSGPTQKNQQGLLTAGFSMLEVMVASGIVSVLGLAAIGLYTYQSQSFRSIGNQFSRSNFSYEVRNFLNLEGTCQSNFQATDINNNSVLDIPALVDPASGTDYYSASGVYSNGNLAINKISLVRGEKLVYDDAKNQVIVPLVLEMNSLGGLEDPQLHRESIQLLVEHDGAGIVTDCFVFSASEEKNGSGDTHWEETAAKDAIYYSGLDQRVGVKISGDDFNNLKEVPGQKNITSIGTNNDIAVASFGSNPTHGGFFEMVKTARDSLGNPVLLGQVGPSSVSIGALRFASVDSNAVSNKRSIEMGFLAMGPHDSATASFDSAIDFRFQDMDELYYDSTKNASSYMEKKFQISSSGRLLMKASVYASDDNMGKPHLNYEHADQGGTPLYIFARDGHTSLSDARTKWIAGLLEVDLQKFLALQVSTFAYKNSPEYQRYGLIAQEVAKLFPELVDKKKSYLRLKEQSFLPLLTGVFQDLDKKLETEPNTEISPHLSFEVLMNQMKGQQP